MNSKMTTNSKLSTTKPKQKQKQTKQTTRTGTEPTEMEITWRVINRGVERGGKGTENKKHK